MLETTTPYEIEMDELLGESVPAALSRERSAFDLEVARFNRKVVLFGAGNLGRQALARLRADGQEPLAFADNRAPAGGTTIEGLHVLTPSEAARKYGDAATFVVTIWNDHHRFAETRDQLTNLGCEHVVPACKLRWKYPETFLPFYAEDLPHKVHEQADRVRKLMDLWADDYSRCEYLAQVRWRLQGDLGGLAAPVADESYFVPELFALSPRESFVDCGAFDGMTIRSFLKQTGSSFHKITALEPDPHNYARLLDYVAGLTPAVRERVAVHQTAVAGHTGVVRFDPLGTLGSAMKADGAIEVPCAALDDLLRESKPTFIKMDIEGAEPAALESARAVIGRHQPILAICLYHLQDHLWNIPLLISELCPSYRLFIRPHEGDGWQLVCYAVPPQRLVHRSFN